ncbi:hypothetical protein FO440_17770 [Mucilaginibacter corticis]|uniref:Uncharacterized protein n=1 Tax=Mucilaginibacter corticis TaxID=2597670 RepID=A0A556MI49_9SPHI|nr:hypothetical protein FO440_17770 [Mucilaginibacter corticis]
MEEAGHIDIAEKISLLEDNASVGSELLMSVTYELLNVIKSNSELNILIGTKVIGLKKYCWSIGLQVK